MGSIPGWETKILHAAQSIYDIYIHTHYIIICYILYILLYIIYNIYIPGILIFVVLTFNGYIKPNKFIVDNQDIFLRLKEEDYDFLVRAKYGDGLDADVLFQKRIRIINCTKRCSFYLLLIKSFKLKRSKIL